MAKKIITGNSLLDRLSSGPYVNNPEYNPKTKAGRTQPKVLLNTEAGDIDGGALSSTVDKLNRIRFTGRDLNLTNEEINEYAEQGLTVNPYTTQEDIYKAKAAAQSGFEQFGNMLVRAGLGQVVYGTLEGFGNIFDGIVNSFTGDNYNTNPWTQFWKQQREELDKNFEIYQKDPNAEFAFGDFGWWMNGTVNAASTLSLMLPAAGWAKGISLVGKTFKVNKALKGVSRWTSKGISKLGKSGNAATKFGELKNIANNANRIDRTIQEGAGIIGQSFLSRTGENYMEASQVYTDVFETSLENLNNMPDEEFAKFIAQHPEFANDNISKEDIAKEIARNAANTTFYNDYAMLLMDVMQFKALGKLWGKGGRRASTAEERIAARNQKLLLAGKTNEELIKNNIINRGKESISYALKNPKDSFLALELGEGFEEMYQGIQTEKGMEVATKYFNPNFTPRTISSYLSDASIWEQGFWGSLGAKLYQGGYSIAREAYNKAEGLYRKKHMTAEDYNLWQKSNSNITVEQINNTISNIQKFVDDMNNIEQGINPYNVIIDKDTGQEVIKDGNVIYEEIDDAQKEYLRNKAIDEFVINSSLNAVDNGTFDLIKEIVGGSEFDQFLNKNGVSTDATEKALSEKVASRMEEVKYIYESELSNINNSADAVNPWITIESARNITRNKLKLQDYNDNIANIELELNNKEADETVYNYIDNLRYTSYVKNINKLRNLRNNYLIKYNNKEISKQALDKHLEDINKQIKIWNDYAFATTKGSLNALKETFNKELNVEELDDSINNLIKEYSSLISSAEDPSFEYVELADKQIELEKRINYTKSQIPNNAKEYSDIYNEFAKASDAIELARKEDYIEVIKQYLHNREDLDEGINNLFYDAIPNKKLKEAVDYLRYNYEVSYNEDNIKQVIDQQLTNTAIDRIINEEREARKNAENIVAEAEDYGVVLPDANQEQTTSETNEEVVLSTGEEEVSNTTNTTVTESRIVNENNINKRDTDIPISDERQETIIISEESIPPTPKIPIDEYVSEDEASMQAELSAGLNNPEFMADLDARQYVIGVGIKEEGRINEITNALKNNDESKLASFVNEVKDFLIKKGYNKNLSDVIAKKTIANTVTMFGALNKDSALGRLAQQLAIGFSKTAAKKYSITELIDGKALNETIEEFLDEYIKSAKLLKIKDKYVINVQSLFNELLTNENIDVNTAVDIFNKLSNYIATNPEAKYTFTGFNTSTGISINGKEFINRLEEAKAQTIASRNKLHIHPIEYSQRTKDYKDALIAAHNGAPTYAVLEKSSIGEDLGTADTHIAIYVDMGTKNKSHPVKIGILKTVYISKDANEIIPLTHNSGFRNSIIIDGKNISLDCDNIFNSIINRDTEDGKRLFEDIVTYYMSVRNIIDSRKKGLIPNVKEYEKLLSEAMTDELAERITDNPVFEKALSEKLFRPYIAKGNEYNYKKAAKQFSITVCNILFYNNESREQGTSDDINNIDTSISGMQTAYENWKYTVYDNYTHTYELQQGLKNEKDKVSIKLNVGYYTDLNIAETNAEQKNIGDLPFNTDSTNIKSYTPFIMVKNGHLIGEDNTDYGLAPVGVRDYSMGFIVYNDDNVQYTAYCRNTVNLRNSEIAKDVRKEIVDILLKQLNNKNIDTHYDNFIEIKDRLLELFGVGGLFRFGNIRISVNPNNSFVRIYNYDIETEKTKEIMTLFSTNNKNEKSHAIKVYRPDGSSINITDLNGSNRSVLTEAVVNIINNLTLNRSSIGFDKQTKSKGTPKLFSWDGKSFIVKLGGKELVYKNYGDFVLKNKGFTTNVINTNGTKEGFVTHKINDSIITADTKVYEKIDNIPVPNTSVSDYCYGTDKNPKRKTVDTNKVLELAGVSQDKIDILLGTNSGIQIVNKRINIKPELNTAYMYYDNKDKSINITPKGATSMNGSPASAIRLILHENLHRLFATKYNDKERNRITQELKEVYEFVRNQIETDYSNGIINDKLHNQFNSVLNKTQTYSTEQTRMEEFLVECLTQAPLTEYLNNTEYGKDAIIDNIDSSKKSIFQKIIDILLDLLGIYDNRIKNNSILAREYVILSKGINSTVNNDIYNVRKEVQTSIPVEGNILDSSSINYVQLYKTKSKIDSIRKDFEARIKRDENFETNHTYLLDGKPIDYSVTQKVHGKQDIGEYSTPASLLGNTADIVSRDYFNNLGVILDDYKIPNVDDNQRGELINSMNKIKEHLDRKFGVNKYRVITEEFPIGGTIEVNGEIKTIAGTMDMIVYTDTGDIYIFDFKTKRIGNGNGNLSEEAKKGYKQQVNIYVDILKANYPELADKIHVGELIKFSVNYPKPSNNILYKKDDNDSTQLMISTNGGKTYYKIQDAPVDYTAPTLPYNYENTDTFIPIERQEYGNKISALPKIAEETTEETTSDKSEINNNIKTKEDVTSQEDFNDTEEYYANESIMDIIDDEFDEFKFSNTPTIISSANTKTEIYSQSIANNNTDNPAGIMVSANMNDFVNSFPPQDRRNIKQLIADNDVNYTCQ